MVHISPLVGYSFKDYSLMTGFTPTDITLGAISLDTKVGEIPLRIPLMSAAMTAVTGYHLALALGKEGGMPVLPLRMKDKDKVGIIKKMKGFSASFVEDPVKAYDTDTVDVVIERMQEHGYSKIPVVNKNNQFKGIFDYNEFAETGGVLTENVMRYVTKRDGVYLSENKDLSVEDAKQIVAEHGLKYLVVVDNLSHLEKMFFQRDMNPIRIGAAISSHSGWEASAKKYISAGADMIFIDTSDGHNGYVQDVVVKFKKMPFVIESGTPICVGNFITYEGVLDALGWGADAVKIGMSTGAPCTTAKEKATGRAAMTALLEADRARNAFKKANNDQHRAIICDGGIEDTADMVIALTCADALMMGRYFSQFFEAAAPKFDKHGKHIDNPAAFRRDIVETLYYGEGSAYAKNMDRYGQGFKTFFPEGEVGFVPYRGMLRPNINDDLKRVKGALQNVGVTNLKDYRENAHIELLSAEAKRTVQDTHGMRTKKD